MASVNALLTPRFTAGMAVEPSVIVAYVKSKSPIALSEDPSILLSYITSTGLATSE